MPICLPPTRRAAASIHNAVPWGAFLGVLTEMRRMKPEALAAESFRLRPRAASTSRLSPAIFCTASSACHAILSVRHRPHFARRRNRRTAPRRRPARRSSACSTLEGRVRNTAPTPRATASLSHVAELYGLKRVNRCFARCRRASTPPADGRAGRGSCADHGGVDGHLNHGITSRRPPSHQPLQLPDSPHPNPAPARPSPWASPESSGSS